MANFPTNLEDNTNLPNPAAGNFTNSPSHAGLHDNTNDAIKAVEAKLGIGASTPTANVFLTGSGTGSSSWGLAVPVGAVVGTSDTQTLSYKLISTGSVIDANVTVTEVLKKTYPVGCIYTSTIATNPSITFGFGTWITFGAGRVLIGAGTSDQTFTAGASGGESNHILALTEQPAVTGSVTMHNSSGFTNVAGVAGAFTATVSPGQYSSPALVGNVTSIGSYQFSNGGTGAAHNNLQPYLVVYLWNRTA